MLTRIITSKIPGALIAIVILTAAVTCRVSAPQQSAPDADVASTFRTQNLLVDQTSTLSGQVATTSTLTIAPRFGSQTLTDWNPTGLSSASTISMEQTSGTTQISGIAAQAAGTELTLYNREASAGVIKLLYEDSGSLPANQIVVPGSASFGFPWTIQPGGSVKLRYDGGNWKFVSSGASLFPYLHALNGADLEGRINIDALDLRTQYDTAVGVQDPFLLFSDTTTVVWAGASAATWKGMQGGADGRHIIVINASAGQTLTITNMGASLGTYDFQNLGNVDQTIVGPGSSAIFDYISTPGNWQMTSLGSTVQKSGPGSITLGGGTGTATVAAGSTCVCTDSTANASVKCALSGTTLTATGTGTDVIKYICL